MEGDDSFDVPGPGAYNIDKKYYEKFKYKGMSLGYIIGRKDEWIGPEVSHLRFFKRLGENYRAKKYHKDVFFPYCTKMEKDLIPIPGPCKYNPINVDLIQIKAPKYSFGRRKRFNNC